MQALQNIKIDELVNKSQKFAEENPVAVGVGAVATLLTGYFVFRRGELSRDGRDYDNQLTGGMRLLNNTDHTLEGQQFHESIVDYENMFAGARKETGAITSEESVEVRKERYASMINHFYNLVTDFYEWGWCQVSSTFYLLAILLTTYFLVFPLRSSLPQRDFLRIHQEN